MMSFFLFFLLECLLIPCDSYHYVCPALGYFNSANFSVTSVSTHSTQQLRKTQKLHKHHTFADFERRPKAEAKVNYWYI